MDQAHSETTKLSQRFKDRCGAGIIRRSVSTLQINVGKLCNQVCRHCHVDAGPHKLRENMDLKTVDRILELVDLAEGIEVVDITGGAPELNPHFRYFVRSLRRRGLEVIDRCNLTVLLLSGQEDLAEFLADQEVHVIASLPCYSEKNVELQRGDGVFRQSIKGLQRLVKLGYGSDFLKLDLVFNPLGPNLPPDQQELERDYKAKLWKDFGIKFNNLYTITNMPIKRFAVSLRQQGAWQYYMDLLKQNFNLNAVESVMCRDLISISWDGKIFDCDFNQMMDLPASRVPTSIWDISTFDTFVSQSIAVEDHCFGCTAGAGSSCKGSIS